MANRLGIQGEALVTQFLQNKGYHLLHKNWRCAQGELDLVMWDGPTLVVVEVRTRRGRNALESALASVNASKQNHLIELAQLYLDAENLPQETSIRIDVVAVAQQANGLFEIEVIEDAVSW